MLDDLKSTIKKENDDLLFKIQDLRYIMLPFDVSRVIPFDLHLFYNTAALLSFLIGELVSFLTFGEIVGENERQGFNLIIVVA